MLVLAMEFSRGAQRATRGVRGQITDRQRGGSSAGERPAFAARAKSASRRRERNRPGLSKQDRNRGSLPQNGIVMPIAIHRALLPGDGTPESVRSVRGEI
jgi:hypothetical protein